MKGNEWTFQFRFWPNNNSRMYVLEGVTPCIQSMQLRAGDTGINQSTDKFLHIPDCGEANMSCKSEIIIVLYDSFVAVTFSRIDPGGKLVMGFRKASNSIDTQVVTQVFPLYCLYPLFWIILLYFFPLFANMINGYCLNRMPLHLPILMAFQQREPLFLVELRICHWEVVVPIFSSQ